ncbi:MAG: polymerase subunit gamma/tau [Acidobacteriota bacterium]|jgi:DNA polymerase-3 subunit gamma/tau|nr:polymerase subunit gamma/tau [Acidobacteriota bacterium]
MSYQVIARKWRPQSFEDVAGQEPITRTLRNAIEHERLHHAYLFSGARGVGKTTTARLLAKALNCHKSDRPTPTPCAIDDPTACASCKEIAEGRSMDVLEIDAASNTQVEKVRDSIIETVSFAPARDRYKVFIIDEVHMLSTSSFNALLKTLEEPPPRVVFIMATTERHKLPETILSRVQQFEFRTIATTKIAERLRQIADEEKVDVSDEALREIARAGEGSMRDAQSAFDQVISFSGSKISVEDVETSLGLASTEMLTRVMTAIGEKRPAEILTVVNDLVMRGHDLRNFCRDLLGHIRDLLVARVYGGKGEQTDSATFDRRMHQQQIENFSESDLVRFFHSLTETESNLRRAAHPRYQLEVGLVKLIEMGRVVPLKDLVERLSALEESIRTGNFKGENETPQSSGGARSSGGRSGPAPSATRARGSSAFGTDTPVARPTREATPFEGLGATEVSIPPAAVLTPTPSSAAAMTNNLTATATAPALDSDSGKPVNGGPVTPEVKAASVRSDIDEIKAVLETRNRMLVLTALDKAESTRIEDDELYVEFAPRDKHMRDSLAKPENIKQLREAAREVFGRDTGIRIVIKDKKHANEPPTREEELRVKNHRLREIADQDPKTQKILRNLRAEIVDVRSLD